MTVSLYLITALVLLRRQQARLLSALKRLEPMIDEDFNQKRLDRLEALKVRASIENATNNDLLIGSIDTLIHAYKAQDNHLIETAYYDLMIVAELKSKSDLALLKHSKHWTPKALNQFGSVKKEHKELFTQAYEKQHKLTINQQAELIHEVINNLVNVKNPYNIKSQSIQSTDGLLSKAKRLFNRSDKKHQGKVIRLEDFRNK